LSTASSSRVPSEWMYVGFFAVTIIELSKTSLFFDRYYFNPTLLFVLSFLTLILIGTILLLLPRSTNGADLSFVDALFMATSAVCVTGLSVVDISSQLTRYGQTIVLLLVQLGGLGMMTFTGFFGYFFSGGLSYKNQLMFTQLVGENRISSVIKTLYKIVIATLLFESIGAIFLYQAVGKDLFNDQGERLYFAVFHAVSAFCNAGFSTLPGGLSHMNIRFNYPILLTIVWLFVLGGLGFGIIFNIYEFIRRWSKNIFSNIFYKRAFVFKAWIIGFNSRIIGYTTALLLIVGLVSVLLLEYDNLLAEHESFFGKVIASLFIGASPRSSGFHIADMANISFPTIMLLLLLMWIGAAPGSTGGGIKTTTFSVAILNIIAIVRGKDKVEVFGREISAESLRRAFAIIALSLICLGIGIFALSVTDGEKGLLSIAFESFSAFSTVGLSLGITSELSEAGRVVLIVTMFIGRVGALTFLMTIVRKSSHKTYSYPEERVLF
jgi:trk system potassium uptake protein TrkH